MESQFANYRFTRKAIDEYQKRALPEDEQTEKYKNLQMINGKLHRVVGENKREIVPLEDVNEKLSEIYRNPESGFRSLDKF